MKRLSPLGEAGRRGRNEEDATTSLGMRDEAQILNILF
jgi:hypothetical protein